MPIGDIVSFKRDIVASVSHDLFLADLATHDQRINGTIPEISDRVSTRHPSGAIRRASLLSSLARTALPPASFMYRRPPRATARRRIAAKTTMSASTRKKPP